jgi:hypothetical protein
MLLERVAGRGSQSHTDFVPQCPKVEYRWRAAIRPSGSGAALRVHWDSQLGCAPKSLVKTSSAEPWKSHFTGAPWKPPVGGSDHPRVELGLLFFQMLSTKILPGAFQKVLPAVFVPCVPILVRVFRDLDFSLPTFRPSATRFLAGRHTDVTDRSSGCGIESGSASGPEIRRPVNSVSTRQPREPREASLGTSLISK